MLSRSWAIFGACGAALLAAATPVQAAGPLSLKSFLFGAPNPDMGVALPPVARYESQGGDGFVLSRLSDGREAIIKYDRSPERWALFASPGPRGDIIYKNDVGQPVLRATRLGGLTLFNSDDPQGSPVASLAVVTTPRPPPMLGPAALLQLIVQSSARASRAAHHFIDFDAAEVVATPATEPVFADAFILTADAFVQACAHRTGLAATSRLVRVAFRQGRGPNALVRGQIVLITIAPDQGVAGRPSSERIVEALLQH